MAALDDKTSSSFQRLLEDLAQFRADGTAGTEAAARAAVERVGREQVRTTAGWLCDICDSYVLRRGMDAAAVKSVLCAAAPSLAALRGASKAKVQAFADVCARIAEILAESDPPPKMRRSIFAELGRVQKRASVCLDELRVTDDDAALQRGRTIRAHLADLDEPVAVRRAIEGIARRVRVEYFDDGVLMAIRKGQRQRAAIPTELPPTILELLPACVQERAEPGSGFSTHPDLPGIYYAFMQERADLPWSVYVGIATPGARKRWTNMADSSHCTHIRSALRRALNHEALDALQRVDVAAAMVLAAHGLSPPGVLHVIVVENFGERHIQRFGNPELGGTTLGKQREVAHIIDAECEYRVAPATGLNDTKYSAGSIIRIRAAQAAVARSCELTALTLSTLPKKH